MRVWAVLLILFLAACAGTSPRVTNRFMVEKRWVRATAVKEHLGSRRQHRFDPIVTEDLVISANSLDGVVAYDRRTANLRWRVPVKDGVEAGAALAGELLLFGASDGFFYAVAVKSGQVRWTFPIRAEGLGQPFVADGAVYFLAGNNVLHALEISSGKLLWVYTRRDSSNLSIRGGSQPNVVGDVVYAGFSDGYLVALKRATGQLIWETSLNRNKRFRDVDAHPVIQGERLFVSSYDGAFYSLNRTDGRILWSVDEGGESAATVVNDRIYYSSSLGAVLCVDRDSGKILWRVENPLGISGQPRIYRDLVVVGELRGSLWFLAARTGERVAEFSPGWGVSSRPVVDEERGEVYFTSAGANLYSLRMAWRRFATIWPWE